MVVNRSSYYSADYFSVSSNRNLKEKSYVRYLSTVLFEFEDSGYESFESLNNLGIFDNLVGYSVSNISSSTSDSMKNGNPFLRSYSLEYPKIGRENSSNELDESLKSGF